MRRAGSSNRGRRRPHAGRWALGAALVTWAVWQGPPATAQPTVLDPGQGVVGLSSGATLAAELSGITWAGGSTYHAVGDNGAKSIWRLSITLDPVTGWITGSPSVTGGLAAPGLGSDSEGIAYRSTTGSVFVADEVASTITEFSLADGGTLGSVPVPTIYGPANVQANMGLESLAWGPGGLWTANEEALGPDGPLATTAAGSWVRIQRFDQSLAPAGQWGYRTDSVSANSPLTTLERSGVVDLLPWTSTGLLVLEREFGGSFLPSFRSRLYFVDTTTADDVSLLPGIGAGGFTPLAKSLLWEGTFGTSNFEGMTFGPTLADGSRSLLLVSDNGGGIGQNLYALQIAPVPEPTALALVLSALALLALRRTETKVRQR
jgi:hypothetical protein